MLSIDCIAPVVSINLFSNKKIEKSITCEIKPAQKEMSFFVKVRGVVVYEAAFLETAIVIYNKIASKKGIEDFLDSPHKKNWKLFFDNNVYFTHSFGDHYTYWKDSLTYLRDKNNNFDSHCSKQILSDFLTRASTVFV